MNSLEDESGSGESDNEEENTEESEESGSESGESDDRDMSRRSAEEDMESLFSKVGDTTWLLIISTRTFSSLITKYHNF